MNIREIGEMIRIRRESRGMTQAQLASAIGMSESAIAMYEAGKRKPKDNTVEALADVFNVPKWSILYREDEMIPANSTASDDEIWRMREDMRRNPELRTLFDLQRKATKSELKQMTAFIKAIRSSNEPEDDDPA